MRVVHVLRDEPSVLCKQEAKELAQKVLNLDASNGHAWHTMGQMEEKQGKLDAALTCYSAGQQGSGESVFPMLIIYLALSSPLIQAAL